MIMIIEDFSSREAFCEQYDMANIVHIDNSKLNPEKMQKLKSLMLNDRNLNSIILSNIDDSVNFVFQFLYYLIKS